MQSRSHLPDVETTVAEAEWRLPPDVTTARAKLVYLYLWSVPRADVAEISRAIREPQLRLYPALEYLADRGLVRRNGSTFAVAVS